MSEKRYAWLQQLKAGDTVIEHTVAYKLGMLRRVETVTPAHVTITDPAGPARLYRTSDGQRVASGSTQAAYRLAKATRAALTKMARQELRARCFYVKKADVGRLTREECLQVLTLFDQLGL